MNNFEILKLRFEEREEKCDSKTGKWWMFCLDDWLIGCLTLGNDLYSVAVIQSPTQICEAFSVQFERRTRKIIIGTSIRSVPQISRLLMLSCMIYNTKTLKKQKN